MRNPRPRAGGDVRPLQREEHPCVVSIHAPPQASRSRPRIFQSTPRMRLRTSLRGCFNPRPPRGGRLSILSRSCALFWFQSTPPARGATIQIRLREHPTAVSIHAPRAGGDGLLVNNSNRWPFQHLIADPPSTARFHHAPHLLGLADPADFPHLTWQRRPHRVSLCASGPRGQASLSHTIRGPSGSYDSFAPTCSTRPFQLSPRK